MASLDNTTTPFKRAICSILLEGGSAESLELYLENSYITWSQPGRTAVEVMPRERHQSTPVVVETSDGNCDGQISLHISSYKGNTAKTPYEVFTRTAGWTTVGVGGRVLIKMTVTEDSTVDNGGSQSGIFAYVDITNVEVGDADSLRQMTVSFSDKENAPTWS